MKDCKCGRIPPCYSGMKFRIHEELEKIKAGDETHDMVYELNKQMCDIGRLISVEEMAERYNKQILQSRLDGLSAWLKSQDMEGKKTKKMTKAEAFEWLDGKKIRTEGNHEKVLRKLFNLGFVWKNLRDTRVDLDWQSGEVYGLTISNDEVAWWNTPHLFETHSAEQVSADDILSIEIVEDTEPECERNEHVKALQELIVKSGCIDCIIISKNDIGILKK